jgi:hypothetical protein
MADLWFEDQRRFIAGSLLAVLPPILIAGLRDSTVGSDTDLYVIPIFNGIASNGQNLIEFIDSYPGMEWGYLLLTFVIAQLTDQSVFLLLSIHVLIILPLYMTAMKWREYLSPVLFMFIYYMIFFQESLSIARQSIALSFSMLAFTFFLEKKYIKYVVFTLCAFLFHQTALVALSFPVFYYIVDRFSIRQNYLSFLAGALMIVLFFLNFDSIMIWMIDNGYLDLKFLKYTTADNEFIPVLGTANFLVKIVIIAYIVYIMVSYEYTFLKFFLVLAIFDMLFSLCALILQPLDRISLYYRLMTCISIPYIIYNYPVIYSDEDTPYTRPIEGMFCVLLFAYWFYVYMLGNYDDTADYQISSSLFI